jgi:LEA14-like dessication related protein
MKWTYLLLAFVLFATGCAKVKEPEFRRVENFRLKNLGFTDVTIGLSVTYFNPNNFNVSVREAVADVYIDSVYLGKFNQDSLVRVGQKAEFSIPLTGTIPTATALKLNMKDIDSREILLQANGTVKVGKAGVYVNKKFNYSGRHKLSELKIGDLMGK